MAKLKVRLRGGFSDRMGIKPENVEMQTETLDERTRNALITTTWSAYQQHIEHTYSEDSRQGLLMSILANVYAQEVNATKWHSEEGVIGTVCDTIREGEYGDVFTVIEYLARELEKEDYRNRASKMYNAIFEREFVGYRIVGGTIVPITDPNEVAAMQEATSSPYEEVNEHLDKSMKFLSDRQDPDYPNSIKESISAVERMCSLIIGESTTLGAALSKLEGKGLTIHPAMKGAFEKLYGYTSDGSGIRHSGQLGGSDSTFEEAKFMLVSCCAFINYLIGAWAKHR